MASFRLDERPWIPVSTHAGELRELSLIEIFEQAEQVRSISGNPLEVASIMRLLLAISQRVTAPLKEYGVADVWDEQTKFLQGCVRYVTDWGTAFDLYGAQRPFMQHPGIEQVTGSPALLLYDRAQGNNPVFLDASLVKVKKPIASSLAARALLVTHAYGGAGTGGLNPLNGSKKDTMYAGPLCARVAALLEGENLAETLILNLVEEVRVGLPAWERDLPGAAKQRPADGVADLYTRCTRLARLEPTADGELCIGASIYMGESVPLDEGSLRDPMIPLYLAKDKKFKALRLEPARALWRSSPVLLASRPVHNQRPLVALEQLRPKVLDGTMSVERLDLRLLGVAANAQGPVTEMWRDESLPFNMGLLRDDERYHRLMRRVETAEEMASALRRRLYSFAATYLQDRSETAADPKDIGKLANELAPDLSDYWSELSPTGEKLAVADIKDDAWEDIVQSASSRAFRAAIDRLPVEARRLRAEFLHAGGKRTKEDKVSA